VSTVLLVNIHLDAQAEHPINAWHAQTSLQTPTTLAWPLPILVHGPAMLGFTTQGGEAVPPAKVGHIVQLEHPYVYHAQQGSTVGPMQPLAQTALLGNLVTFRLESAAHVQWGLILEPRHLLAFPCPAIQVHIFQVIPV
jgi:hypothetical protein